jgi:hypothetical protein
MATSGCAFDAKDAPLVGLAEMAKGKSDRSPWPACSYYYGQSAAAVYANGLVYAGGAIVDGDQLCITPGYGMFGQMPGNMLLVYGLKR